MERQGNQIVLLYRYECSDAVEAARVAGFQGVLNYKRLQHDELPATMDVEASTAAIEGFRLVASGKKNSPNLSHHTASEYLSELNLD